jgi:hypothetical protein
MLMPPSLGPRRKNKQEEIMPITPNQTYRMYSPNLSSMMREVLHTLGDIDFQYDVELEKIENTSRDEDLKSTIRKKIQAAHRQKRQPYVDLVESLRRQQYRQSFAA